MRLSIERRLQRRLERAFLVLLLPACKADVPTDYGSCCTEGEWTTSADVAKAYASKDSTEVQGCPNKVTRTAPASDASVPDASAPPGDLDLFAEPTKKLRATGDTACVYKTISCCPGGRPLYARGVDLPLVASRARAHGGWSRRVLPPLGTSLAAPERAEIARGWLEDAFAEHASVASFALATLELMAVGAPRSLLAGHQRAALEEIGHAERCFALARAYGADAVAPGPLAIPPLRDADLVRVACDTFAEGCVAETIGALLAARALETCTVREVRDALRTIAEEEASHAALAWKTLAWAIEQGGEGVVHAVLARASTLRNARKPSASRSEPARFAAHGRLEEADLGRATEDAWRLMIDPLLVRAKA